MPNASPAPSPTDPAAKPEASTLFAPSMSISETLLPCLQTGTSVRSSQRVSVSRGIPLSQTKLLISSHQTRFIHLSPDFCPCSSFSLFPIGSSQHIVTPRPPGVSSRCTNVGETLIVSAPTLF